MIASWTPGEHHGLVWPAGVALLEARVEPTTVNRLWERVRGLDELGDFLTALSEVIGSGLLDLPAFAVAVGVPGDELHLAARGRLVAAVTTTAGRVEVTGDGVTTWVEKQVRHATGVLLAAPGAAAPGPGDRVLESGVVPAATLSAALTERPARSAAPPATPASPAAPAAAPARPVPAQRPGFISAVPGFARTGPAPASPLPPASPAPAPAEPAPAFAAPFPEPADFTRLRSDDDPPRPPLTAAPARPAPLPGHPMAPARPGPPTPSDDVLAVLCSSGHANPPQRPRCRVCSTALSAAPTRVPRPALGRVVAASGESLELTGPIVIGRAPRADRFRGAVAPRLLSLPQAHISSSHLALRIEDWNVLVVDLGSTNGTFLRRNGQPPFRLSDKPHLLVPGDVVDLGHGVHLRFEELP